MKNLPNPFVPEIPADEPSRFVLDELAFMAAIEDDQPLYGTGPAMLELPIVHAHNERRRREIAEHDQLPMFLADPTPEYLAATDLIPVLAVLAGH